MTDIVWGANVAQVGTPVRLDDSPAQNNGFLPPTGGDPRMTPTPGGFSCAIDAHVSTNGNSVVSVIVPLSAAPPFTFTDDRMIRIIARVHWDTRPEGSLSFVMGAVVCNLRVYPWNDTFSDTALPAVPLDMKYFPGTRLVMNGDPAGLPADMAVSWVISKTDWDAFIAGGNPSLLFDLVISTSTVKDSPALAYTVTAIEVQALEASGGAAGGGPNAQGSWIAKPPSTTLNWSQTDPLAVYSFDAAAGVADVSLPAGLIPDCAGQFDMRSSAVMLSATLAPVHVQMDAEVEVALHLEIDVPDIGSPGEVTLTLASRAGSFVPGGFTSSLPINPQISAPSASNPATFAATSLYTAAGSHGLENVGPGRVVWDLTIRVQMAQYQIGFTFDVSLGYLWGVPPLPALTAPQAARTAITATVTKGAAAPGGAAGPNVLHFRDPADGVFKPLTGVSVRGFPCEPTGPQAPSTPALGQWTWDAAASVSAGGIAAPGAISAAGAGSIYIHPTDAGGTDRTATLAAIVAGDVVTLKQGEAVVTAIATGAYFAMLKSLDVTYRTGGPWEFAADSPVEVWATKP
jgi:hypothetical protein